MSFSVGIIGLPNVGKSTLFSAITKAQVDCANYPFCTIEPNKAMVAVPDERLTKLAAQENSEKILPTTIEFVDIAGLVAGAHKGEGLGNKFLSHIREVDAIVHVVRAFEDENVTHVSGKINPESDKQTVLLELILADIEYIQKIIQGFERKAKNDKDLKAKLEIYKKIESVLLQEKLASQTNLSSEEQKMSRDLQLLTDKPLITVINSSNGPNLTLNDQILSLTLNIKQEYDISQLPEDEKQDYIKELGLPEPGLNELIAITYKALNLITFITAGPKETKAWTIVAGTKAPQAAGKIHSDFERGFIKAEVVAWDKLLEAGGYANAREKGWLRLEGKDYALRDGDVVHFKFNI